jgi:hypothetical protein
MLRQSEAKEHEQEEVSFNGNAFFFYYYSREKKAL